MLIGTIVCILFIALALMIVGLVMILKSDAPSYEGTGAIFVTVGAAFFGAALTLIVTGDYSVKKPRVPNVHGVILTENSVKFPTLTEAGSSWCIITEKTGAKGVFVSGDTYLLSDSEKGKEVRVYISFPDGKNSSSAPVGKGGATGAGPAPETGSGPEDPKPEDKLPPTT